MGKGFFKILSVALLVTSFFIPGAFVFSAFGWNLAGSYALILQGLSAISATIGFAPEVDLGTSRLLADNLSEPETLRAPAQVVDPEWL